MSELKEAGLDSETDELREVIAHIQDSDWFLADLIRIFANNGVAFPLTLVVGGSVVSGKLIGGKQYFQQVSETISQGTTNNSQVRDFLVKMVEGNKLRYERPEGADENWSLPEPGFVHLEGARIFNGSAEPIPQGEGVLWRAKLTSVDAFSFWRAYSQVTP